MPTSDIEPEPETDNEHPHLKKGEFAFLKLLRTRRNWCQCDEPVPDGTGYFSDGDIPLGERCECGGFMGNTGGF
jgi:hypothetical protein